MIHRVPIESVTRSHAGHYFDRDTMRFFGSRVARLIAAAPDMLAALRGLVHLAPMLADNEASRLALAAARSAIARATQS